MFSKIDFQYMQRALALAERGLYTTTPNPRVGCVLVHNEQVIGEGFTQPPGQNHAEIQALNDARARGLSVAGATAYVTLEPCSHFGRTPPCANALVEAGITRVIAAMEDPNPKVSGRGFARLREAGIEVRCGLMELEARELNIGFVSRMTRGRPWVRMKVAASLDGGSALFNGQSQWITSPEARADGHAWRARACAILTGIGTVKQDNPRLTVRDLAINTPRQPRRIVVDSQLEIDLESHLVKSGDLILVCARRDAGKEQELIDRGCEILHLPNMHGKVDLAALLLELGPRGINELHIEGGYRLNGALIQAARVDELLFYVAPSLLGDARRLFQLPVLENLSDRWPLQFHEVSRVGPDLRILARFAASATTSPIHSIES